MGWGGGVVAHVILVSAQGPNPFFSFFGGLLFDLGACWDQDLDLGLTIFAFLLKLIFTGFDICGMDVRTARSNANKCGIKKD